jgi:hypothetical protein
MFPKSFGLRLCSAGLVTVLLASATVLAGYKPHPWKLRAAEDYPARLTSEGITIAAEPLFLDALAGQVFDKDDIVTRGIMPLGVVIFNDNPFPVRLDSSTIEIIEGDEHIHAIPPSDAVHQLFKGSRNILVPSSIPKQTLNPEALADFELKSLEGKEIGAHDKGGGFLYLRISSRDIRSDLSRSRLYIPDIYRQDKGSRLIFFEIDLKPAIEAIPAK